MVCYFYGINTRGQDADIKGILITCLQYQTACKYIFPSQGLYDMSIIKLFCSNTGTTVS